MTLLRPLSRREIQSAALNCPRFVASFAATNNFDPRACPSVIPRTIRGSDGRTLAGIGFRGDAAVDHHRNLAHVPDGPRYIDKGYKINNATSKCSKGIMFVKSNTGRRKGYIAFKTTVAAPKAYVLS